MPGYLSMRRDFQLFLGARESFTFCDYNWENVTAAAENHRPAAGDVHFLRHEEVYIWQCGSYGSDKIAEAYLQHGAEAARSASSGGSFVLYDAARDFVLAVRDFIGNYPLYYHVSPGAVPRHTFSFSLNALMEAKGNELRLNYAKVVEYVPCRKGLAPNDEVFFQDTYRLLPAHLMSIERGRVASRRCYGRFDLGQYRDWADEAYVRRFEELFVESVKRATQPYGKVASSLSGGLDSSAVCSVAQSLRREAVLALNYDPGTDEGRETDYIAAVVDKWRLDQQTVQTTRTGYEAIRELTRLSGQPLFVIGYSNHLDLIDAARQQQCDLFLSGHWGDQVVNHGLFYLKELAAKQDWNGLKLAIRQHFDHSFDMVPQDDEATPTGKHRAMKYVTVQLVAGSRPNKTWRQWPAIIGILMSRLGFSVIDLWHFVRQRSENKRREFAPVPLIRPEVLAAATEQPIAPKLDIGDLVDEPLSPAQRQYLLGIFQNNESYGQEEFFEIYRQSGLRSAQPFVDAALIELNLSVPNRLKFDEGRKRGTIRRALAAYLPSKVANRVTKASFSQYHLEELRKLHQEFCAKTPDDHPIWNTVSRSAFERQARFVLSADEDASAVAVAKRPILRVIMLAIWLDCWEESKRPARKIDG